MEESLFITPEGHKGFSAKMLFNEMGKIERGALAYIEKNGGGPEGNHTHSVIRNFTCPSFFISQAN